MTNTQLEFAESLLVDSGYVTKGELSLVFRISGRSEETVNSITYATTGYHDFVSLLEDDPSDEEVLKEYLSLQWITE